MANSLFNQLNQNRGSLGYTLNAVRNSANPYQTLMNLSRNNPNVSRIMDEVKRNGGDAKALFYAKAKEMGVDPNVILNQLR